MEADCCEACGGAIDAQHYAEIGGGGLATVCAACHEANSPGMARTRAALAALAIVEVAMARRDAGTAEIDAVMQARDAVALCFAEETREINPDVDATMRTLRHDVGTAKGRAWIEDVVRASAGGAS